MPEAATHLRNDPDWIAEQTRLVAEHVERRVWDYTDEQLRDIARNSPAGLGFVTGGPRWQFPKHLQVLNNELMHAVLNPGTWLLVHMPPRHGKSWGCSRDLPAWFLGNFPDRMVGLIGYSDDFAEEWGQKTRDVLNEWGEPLFNVKIRSDSRAAKRWSIAEYHGGMLAVGMGGGIMGRGFHLMIVDDPIKDFEQALSKTYRDRHWNWLGSTALDRLEPGGSFICIMHRWHSDDMVGRIKRHAIEHGREVREIRFTALAEANDPLGRKEGEALWPERYDEKHHEQWKKEHPIWFAAKGQGRPVPMGGAHFQAEWFNEQKFTWLGTPGALAEGYRVKRTGRSCRRGDCIVFIMLDPSLGKKDAGDPQGFGVFAITPADHLLCLHIKSQKIPYEKLVDELAEWSDVWKPEYIGVEANGFQVFVASLARAHRKINCPIKEIKPKGKSKLVRGIPAVETAVSGNIFVPEGEDWVAPFIEELTEWTGAEDDRDDRVDILSYAVMELLTVRNQVDDVDRRPAVGRPRYGIR